MRIIGKKKTPKTGLPSEYIVILFSRNADNAYARLLKYRVSEILGITHLIYSVMATHDIFFKYIFLNPRVRLKNPSLNRLQQHYPSYTPSKW